jgi:hypothetical protein
VHRSKVAPLFDHLVGNGEHARRNSEAERLRRLEIDHQLEFGGLKDRKIGKFRTFENSAGVNAGLPDAIRRAGSITHQAAVSSEHAPLVDRGNIKARGPRNQLPAVKRKKWIGGDDALARCCMRAAKAASNSPIALA